MKDTDKYKVLPPNGFWEKWFRYGYSLECKACKHVWWWDHWIHNNCPACDAREWEEAVAAIEAKAREARIQEMEEAYWRAIQRQLSNTEYLVDRAMELQIAVEEKMSQG